MFTVPRIEPPFGAQVAIERVASALGWEILEIVGKLGGDIRLFSKSLRQLVMVGDQVGPPNGSFSTLLG
jgi:hypothetical protein